MMRRVLFILVGFTISTSSLSADSTNPPADGFDLAGSDAKAIEIADDVMEALGGRENWDATRFVSWRFFGKRFHVWDKWTGNIRVEDNDLTILMNIDTKEGRAWRDGTEITDETELGKALERGMALWINDSYWVFMPYKLKDTGVTLKYVGAGKTSEGADAEILQLTFADVGVTPENRYLVYVDSQTMHVVQWDYFENASDGEPGMSTPWHNWQTHGGIMLSDGRGKGSHTDIAVFDSLPASVFESPEPADLPVQ